MSYRSKFMNLALCASAVAGCYDATPVVLPNDQTGLTIEGGVPSTTDGGDGGIDYAHPECHACIVAPTDPGPGCGNDVEDCKASDRCMEVFECAYRRGCVTKPTRDESMACALPCTTELGIKDVTSPSIQSAIRLTTCFHSVCASVCEVHDTAP